MFSFALKFNQPIDDWNVSSVTNIMNDIYIICKQYDFSMQVLYKTRRFMNFLCMDSFLLLLWRTMWKLFLIFYAKNSVQV